MESILRFFWGVPHCCKEQMHWLVHLSLSLTLCLLFIWFASSVMWSEIPKRPQFCYFRMDDPGDWGRISLCTSGTCVCIHDCEHALVWHSGYTLCVFACFCFRIISNHNYAFFLLATYENTLNTITDGGVSSERWFKSNISKERVTVERAEGPNGCLSCHKSSPGCDEGKSISTVGHEVSAYYVMALSRAITINHFNWSPALQSMGFKWRLFNH